MSNPEVPAAELASGSTPATEQIGGSNVQPLRLYPIEVESFKSGLKAANETFELSPADVAAITDAELQTQFPVQPVRMSTLDDRFTEDRVAQMQLVEAKAWGLLG